MVDIRNTRISEYNYNLPENRIAKHPLEQRDSSKLLVYRKGQICETTFNLLSQELADNSFMILNNTKVVRARLRFKKTSGGNIEVFLLEPLTPSDYDLSFSSTGPVVWKCLVGNLKRWKNGDLQMQIPQSDISVTATKSAIYNGEVEITFRWDSRSLSFADIVERCGEMPIPPYLNRKAEEADSTRYQTVYAQPEGSVAAPTAGLHFSDEVFKQLALKHIAPHYLTLHVGAGTFRPMKTEQIGEHTMHTEHFIVSRELIHDYLCAKGPHVVIGTTSLRALESMYLLGTKLVNGIHLNHYFISQWEAYSMKLTSVEQAFTALLRHMDERGMAHLQASTQIMLAPGYKIRTADALLTNFHQPQSTLLLLVAALVGPDWHKIYDYALQHDFRFLSYGDSSLLFNPATRI